VVTWRVHKSTNRQVILVRVKEVVQVINGHNQIGLMDQAGGRKWFTSTWSLGICVQTRCGKAADFGKSGRDTSTVGELPHAPKIGHTQLIC